MAIERTDPPQAATQLAFLDCHRDTSRMKTGGLSQEQLNPTLRPSTITLGGLLKQLALGAVGR